MLVGLPDGIPQALMLFASVQYFFFLSSDAVSSNSPIVSSHCSDLLLNPSSDFFSISYIAFFSSDISFSFVYVSYVFIGISVLLMQHFLNFAHIFF